MANKEILEKMISLIEDYSIIMIDLYGNILSWNLGAEKICGYSHDEAIGQNFRIFYSNKDVENDVPDMLLEEAIQNTHAQQEGWRYRKDGSKFWAEVTITTILDDGGKRIGYSQVTKDLTEKREAEIDLAKHAQELEEKNRHLEELTYIVSHDLKSPLNGISRTLGMLKQQIPTNVIEHPEFAMLQKSVTRMRAVIEDVLEHSLIGHNQIISSVDLNLVIEDVLTDLREKIEENQAKFNITKLPTVPGYPTAIRLLFQNLISNAIKFRKPMTPPLIEINYEFSYGQHHITITDNGIGIDEDYFGKIFKVFQRLHTNRTYPGTGIGLANCLKVVELHQGQIWVVSKVNEGSTFHVKLPDKISHLKKVT